jgi:hypothetical protein
VKPSHPDAPALESIGTALGLLVEQVVAIADRHRDDPDDTLVRNLDDLERSMVSAGRRLDRLVRTLG